MSERGEALEYRTKVVIHDESFDIRHIGRTDLTIKHEHIPFKTRVKMIYGYGLRALVMSGSAFTMQHPNYPTNTRHLYPGDEFTLHHTIHLLAEGLRRDKYMLKNSHFPLLLIYQGRQYNITRDGDTLKMEAK